MALILNIDTATSNASVCVSNDTTVLSQINSNDQKNHASFIQPAIKTVIADANISFEELEAIAVSAGPGSYTGLRVGLSTAKGLCYATGKNLIMINTLEIMALASIEQNNNRGDFLYCPMIDARRMEVYSAIYNSSLTNIFTPSAVILDEKSFEEILETDNIIFSGDGSTKFKNIITNKNAFFSGVIHNASHLAILATKYLAKKEFANLAYSEPLYLKEFFTR